MISNTIDRIDAELIQPLKVGERARVDLISISGMKKIYKQYHPACDCFYRSELFNLSFIGSINFKEFVDAESTDSDSRSIIFPYIEGGNARECLLELRDINTIGEMLASIMVLEIAASTDSKRSFSIPEGLRQTNNPFFYTKLLTTSEAYRVQSQAPNKVVNSIAHLLKECTVNPVWGRCDPEFSNYIYDEGNDKVMAIDYENMILYDSLYPFAYAMIHLKKDNELKGILPKDYSNEFSRIAQRVVENSGNGLFHTDSLEKHLLLNISEVLAYLFIESNDRAKKSQEHRSRYLPQAEWAKNTLTEVLN